MTKTKTTSVEIFTESEATFNKALLSALTCDDKRALAHAKEYNEILDLFSSDPDYINVDGLKMTFIEVDIKSVKCIVVPDYAIEKGYGEEIDLFNTEKMKTMLTAFFSENFKDSYTHEDSQNTWDYFNNTDAAIAFRGGSGYVYTIWTYTA